MIISPLVSATGEVKKSKNGIFVQLQSRWNLAGKNWNDFDFSSFRSFRYGPLSSYFDITDDCGRLDVAYTPIPSPVLLLASGLAGVMAIRRKFRA